MCPALKKPLVLLEKLFLKYASAERNGVKFMTRRDFIASMVPKEGDLTEALQLDVFHELFPTEDTLISFSEFVLFDALASSTKKALATAFQVFDKDGDGFLSKGSHPSSLKQRALLRRGVTLVPHR